MRGRGRGRGHGAPSRVHPTPPPVASAPSRSGGFEYNVLSPRFNQDWPPLAAAVSSSIAVPDDPAVQQGATGLFSSSPSPARVDRPIQDAPGDLRRFNYTNTTHASLENEFYRYLKANPDYERQILGITNMNKKHKTSDPYIIRVTYKEMVEFNAGPDLIIATCNSIKQNTLSLWLIPAGQRFLDDNSCINQEPKNTNRCLSFSGFPSSMQKLEDFTKNTLVEYVGQIHILATTFYGRLLIEMPMVTMLENHSQKNSWNGTFSKDDILIIKRSKRGRVTTYETYEMKILQKPMELEGQILHEAMVRDLQKLAEIFIPLYKMGADYPAHFFEFNEALTAKQEFVAEIWFIKYLTHHPAIMSPTGRRTFWIKLHRAIVDKKKRRRELMQPEPTPCTYVWKAIVESEFQAYNPANKDIITALEKVYRHRNKEGKYYKNTVCGLVRFMRNVLAHGMHDRCELELYLAKMFSGFLPSVLQDLLESGLMEKDFEGAWTAYEVSKFIKTNGIQVQVVTTGGVRRP